MNVAIVILFVLAIGLLLWNEHEKIKATEEHEETISSLKNDITLQNKKISELQETLTALQTSAIQNKDQLEKKIHDSEEWHKTRVNAAVNKVDNVTKLFHENVEHLQKENQKTADLVHQLHLQTLKALGETKHLAEATDDKVKEMTVACTKIGEDNKRILKRQDILHNKLKRQRAVMASDDAETDAVLGKIKEAAENAKGL